MRQVSGTGIRQKACGDYHKVASRSAQGKAGQHSSLYLDSIQARCDRLPLLVMLSYQCACVQSPSLLIQNEYAYGTCIWPYGAIWMSPPTAADQSPCPAC